VSNKHGSTAAEQHYVISPTTPSGDDIKIGLIWKDSDDGKWYSCTSLNPDVFTELIGGHDLVTIGADVRHSIVGQVLSGVAASQTQSGHVELATAAEIDTGTDAVRAIPPDQYVASKRNVRYFLYRVLDKDTSHTVVASIGGDLELLFTGTVVEIGAFVDTAGGTGTGTIDNLNGVTLMTTNKITLDSTEKSSRTAATQPVLTTTVVVVGDIITVDIDALHTTSAKGLTIRLGIRYT